MGRKLLTFIAVLALSTILKVIPTTAQPRGAQPTSDASASSLVAIQQPNSAGQQQPSKPDERPTAPLVTITVNPSDPNQRTDNPRGGATEREQRSGLDPNWVIAVLTIVLAGAAVFQFLTMKRQADAMEKQLAEMRGQVAAAQT